LFVRLGCQDGLFMSTLSRWLLQSCAGQVKIWLCQCQIEKHDEAMAVEEQKWKTKTAGEMSLEFEQLNKYKFHWSEDVTEELRLPSLCPRCFCGCASSRVMMVCFNASLA